MIVQGYRKFHSLVYLTTQKLWSFFMPELSYLKAIDTLSITSVEK